MSSRNNGQRNGDGSERNGVGKGNKFKLTWTFIFQFYDAYSRSKNLAKVAACLGTTGNVLQARIDRYKPLRKAMEVSDSYQPFRSLSTFVFSQLSEEGQQVWKRLQKAGSLEAIEAIFAGRTKQLRQELFIYALVNTSYDLSSACRMVGIDRSLLGKWRHDLEFMQLLEEIQWHKKNYFETQLVQLVEERHPGAVLFVNRTLNADRGYSEKLQIHNPGADAAGLDISDLDLDLETRKKVLAAIRAKKLRDQNVQLRLPQARPIEVSAFPVDDDEDAKSSRA